MIMQCYPTIIELRIQGGWTLFLENPARSFPKGANPIFLAENLRIGTRWNVR
jgi:hypothetical protein